MFVLRGNRSRGGRSVSFREKIGVLGIHESMLPENSFPQICVVSINESVEISPNSQDYRRSADESNRVGLLISNGVFALTHASPARLTRHRELTRDWRQASDSMHVTRAQFCCPLRFCASAGLHAPSQCALRSPTRSEEHTSELQSLRHLV